jgi:hypothetical protein
VAHACNPSYSGGRDQEDHGLKAAWANSLRDPISKKPITKKAGGVAQGVSPEFKPQYCQKKRKEKKIKTHSLTSFFTFPKCCTLVIKFEILGCLVYISSSNI